MNKETPKQPLELMLIKNKILMLSHYHRFITLNSPTIHK